jgi:amidophosphoribosyltransferase
VLQQRVRGAYACVVEIAGYGVLGFRDPFGIRPICYGVAETESGTEYLIASESVALEGSGFKFVRDVDPGEAVFVDLEGNFYSQQCAPRSQLNPCIFEYVYFARPDSVLDGTSVYDARLKLGENLADTVKSAWSTGEIDVVMPIPDTSRPSAMQLAMRLGLDYREGFIKNRYVGRTFIMPGQAVREKSVRQKLNAMSIEFRGKNVLLVDDSIVRGTTSREIVMMAREAGANKVFFASAAPPIRFPNVYGIDMPTRDELIAHGRSDEEIPNCDRRGRTGVPEHRVHEAGGDRGGTAGEAVRGLLLRWLLRDRRHHARVSRPRRERATDTVRHGGRRRSQPDEPEVLRRTGIAFDRAGGNALRHP